MKLGQRGIAPLVIAAIVIALLGGAVATPVAASAANVDPDSPLYGLKRIGERIRGLSEEEQLKLRWQEFNNMVAKGKAADYRNILDEFREKMRNIVETMPDKFEAKREVIQWMQQQIDNAKETRLMLMQQALEQLTSELENYSELAPILENIKAELENLRTQLRLNLQEREQILARIHELSEEMRQLMLNLRDRVQERVRTQIEKYLELENEVEGAEINMGAGVAIGQIGLENLVPKFNEMLEEFNSKLAEVQGKLENVEVNSAEVLVNVAVKLKESAVADFNENKIRNALAELYAANVHLSNAEKLLERQENFINAREERLSVLKENFQEKIAEILAKIENMPDEVKSRVQDLLELAQISFDNGRYQAAYSYLEHIGKLVENIQSRVEMGLPPLPGPKEKVSPENKGKK